MGSYYTHLTDEESQAQSHEGACPRGGVVFQTLGNGDQGRNPGTDDKVRRVQGQAL